MPAAAVGVDLGATNIRVAVIQADGSLEKRVRFQLSGREPEAVVRQMSGAIREVLGQAGLELAQIGGIGIGVAAQMRGETGVVASAPNLEWREVPFGEMMQNALGRRVLVANDVEAIAWGETCFGAARGHRDVLTVIPGTGIGGGLVLGGKLYRGASGVAAEIGHVKVRDPGEPCGCGGRGCLEAYLGGANLTRRLQREVSRGWTALLDKAGGNPEDIHPGLVEELLAEEDDRATQLFVELAALFGTVLANAVTLLNPSALVLDGTVLRGCPTLRARTVEVLRERVLPVAGESLEILQARLGDEAGVIGAAWLASQPASPY